MPFSEISAILEDVWQDSYGSSEENQPSQRGMVLNRGWGESPESSIELLNGPDDGSVVQKPVDSDSTSAIEGLGNTELFGFPGMLFEVLKNDTVSCLTVY